MKIIRAAEMGMCFGVRDALQVTKEVADPRQVTIHGELVHNPKVVYQLGKAGFSQVSESKRDSIAPTPLVLITAHGVSNKERERLYADGKQLIDTTCPLVRRAHDAAMGLASEGRHVVLIGKADHVEVRGIVEDLDSFDVVASPSDVRRYESQSLGILAQTTMPTRLVDEIREQIQRRNPGASIRFVDTVCRPTKLRQEAMSELIQSADVVVVVGGRNSNNTRRLVELCRQNDVPAWQVTCAEEINPAWFEGAGTVGLTAGTSTLDATIDEVHKRLEEIAAGKLPNVTHSIDELPQAAFHRECHG